MKKIYILKVLQDTIISYYTHTYALSLMNPSSSSSNSNKLTQELMNNDDSNLFNKEEEHNNILLKLQEHSNKTNDKKSRYKHIMNVLQSYILVLMSLLQDNNHH